VDAFTYVARTNHISTHFHTNYGDQAQSKIRKNRVSWSDLAVEQ